MSYPLSDTARYVWRRIAVLVAQLLRVPSSRRYLFALANGERPEEFPSRLLVELQALSDGHWPLIEPLIPESCTDGLDLRRREAWADFLGPTDLDPAVISKVRWIFFRSLERAASYVLERDRAAAAGGPAITSNNATDGFFSVSDLATRHNVPDEQVPALRKRLERWRGENALGTDWIERDARARNEDKYLYRESAVLHLIRNE